MTQGHDESSPKVTTSHQDGHISTAHSHPRSDGLDAVTTPHIHSAEQEESATQNKQHASVNYDIRDSYQSLDDADRRQRRASQVSNRQARLLQRRPSASGVRYDVPYSYINVLESSDIPPVEYPEEADIYRYRSLEQSRSRDQEYLKRQQSQRRESRGSLAGDDQPKVVAEKRDEVDQGGELKVSKLATQIYTISYLILFSFFGTVARLGLQALTFYPGAPIPFSSVWPNFGGCVVMGFLSEDRMLFLFEWGTPTYEQQIMKARQKRQEDEGAQSSSTEEEVDLTAAKKAHMATKKTIPLYIGLATGFCGSFTSFSSFSRDVFLALSNDMPTPELDDTTVPRNGGYSFMALVAVIVTTVGLSIAGFFTGAHLAIALEPITPSLPFALTRKILDRLAVFLAFGCWLGAILLSILPPDRFTNPGASETWRGRTTFALVFAPLGCLARFYASLYLNGRITSFPLGTFTVNMFGTAILGMAWDVAHVPDGSVVGCQVLEGIEDGFCGCLTTVSTWVSELAGLRRRHAYVYGGASVVCALALMVAIMGGLRWSDGFEGLVCLK